MFDSIGGGEIMLILLAILVLFGPKRIPDLAQSLGKGLREFRKAQQDLQDNLSKVVNSEDMNKISQTFQDIRQDMHTSVKKLTGEISSATQFPAPTVQPSAPLPAPSTSEPVAPDQTSSATASDAPSSNGASSEIPPAPPAS